MLTFNKASYSQPFNTLIDKILLQDESINTSKTIIKKNKNDLSSTRSLYTPKLNLTLPVGREILVNNDSNNTDLNYYEIDAKITQNIYDFGATSSKIDIAKNQLELSEISSKNVKSNKILEALAAYLNYMKTFNILKYAKESEKRIKTVTRLENAKASGQQISFCNTSKFSQKILKNVARKNCLKLYEPFSCFLFFHAIGE